MKKKNIFPPVSVIVIMRNASTTVTSALQSLIKQNYPLKDIIVVDNASTDGSTKLVLDFAKKNKILITLIRHEKNMGVSTSFNDGAQKARADLLVFMMSDGILEKETEIEKLTLPLREDKKIVGSYANTLQPEYVWNTYNYWQKYDAARTVDSTSPMMTGHFDCIRKDVFDKIGGFDTSNFGEGEIGGEDADFSLRLQKEGQVVRSKAEVVHLHYVGSNFSLKDILRSHKIYARAYGRLLRRYMFHFPKELISLLFKPILAVIPFIPFLHMFGVGLIVLYSFFYTKKMFLSPFTLMNPRIILIPFLNILLLYYHVFWMAQAFLMKREQYGNSHS